MNNNIKCWACKNTIKDYNIIYMCVDNSFCSTYCRDKHYQYIKNIDPDLNYPYKWNKNNAKINCFIEIDYFNVYETNHACAKLKKSQSLYELNTNNDNIKKGKMIITCINFHKFKFHISNDILKKSILIISVIMLGIIIKSNY